MNFSPVKNAMGIISTHQAATQVLDELRAIDFPMQKISVFTLDSEHEKLHKDANAIKHTMTPIEGAKAGAITGGTAGGFLALTAGLGVLVIPGFGPALAVESVVGTLLAGGASALFGSVYGAFQGWFAPERQVLLCQPTSQEEFLVKVEGTVDEIWQAEPILRYWGVREWHVYELSKRFS
ncbi:hypothetical protein [Dendronalium sp. ChiSLP03b]|uniref:hypothetical protein n=1 Tax=Dendronalium sp. ChiSLP03b TaxID=3075381 RepID=UPI002AD3A76B|nr:hypothetical protein [Dendronalium sp. ChiSLP03b]MDZ8209076.1 hypothetical protein [Dendronalium sp. ChiSLP03b]